MKVIPLTMGMDALVDDEDYDHLMQWKWSSGGKPEYRYAHRGDAVGNSIRMSVEVARRMGLNIACKIDHRDRNPLNNQRLNLREATQSQNGANRGPNRNNRSGYKGIWWHPLRSRWYASIRVNRRKINLGCFSDPKDAARAYNAAAIKHFGEFAYLNPV